MSNHVSPFLMPKRFHRLFFPPAGTALAARLGTDLHVVLRTGQVLRGRLVKVDPAGTLTVEDGRRHRHVVPLAEVAEVISDAVTPF
jgi:hypothetical protein